MIRKEQVKRGEKQVKRGKLKRSDVIVFVLILFYIGRFLEGSFDRKLVDFGDDEFEKIQELKWKLNRWNGS
jgi:hypothetical protein